MSQFQCTSTPPALPQCWYFACSSGDLRSAPSRIVSFRIQDSDFIAFRSTAGKVTVLSGRCCHMGAALRNGDVVDDCIECPLHGWRFNQSGECTHIPAGDSIPPWAKLRSYDSIERYGCVFFFLGDRPRFQIPPFEGVDEKEFVITPPLSFDVECPWYMAAANGFDVQHFYTSHDRVLVKTPVLNQKSEFTLCLKLNLKIIRSDFVNLFIARFLGNLIDFSIVNTGGNTLQVTSILKHSKSYGLVNIIPVSPTRCRVINIVMIERSVGAMARLLIDRPNARIRRSYIRRFLSSDQPRIEGTDAIFTRFQPADFYMREFFKWLYSIHEIKTNFKDQGEDLCAALK